jgi:hypothetical protein
MTHDKILGYINFVANKFQEGLVLTPEQYNILGNTYNQLLFQREYEMVEVFARQQGKEIYEVLHNSTSLRIFKGEEEITISNGEGDLPEDYVFCYALEAKYGDTIKMIDIVPERTFLIKRSDISSNIDYNPIATLGPTTLKVAPSPDSVTMIYLRKPADIIYDYCVIEDTDTVIYMPPGSVIDDDGSSSGGYELQDENGDLIMSGVVHHTADEYPYDSQSVEFEWEDRMMTKIMGMILESMGVNLKDQFMFEFAKMQQQ